MKIGFARGLPRPVTAIPRAAATMEEPPPTPNRVARMAVPWLHPPTREGFHAKPRNLREPDAAFVRDPRASGIGFNYTVIPRPGFSRAKDISKRGPAPNGASLMVVSISKGAFKNASASPLHCRGIGWLRPYCHCALVEAPFGPAPAIRSKGNDAKVDEVKARRRFSKSFQRGQSTRFGGQTTPAYTWDSPPGGHALRSSQTAPAYAWDSLSVSPERAKF
jgi:hypothetical protein